MDDGFVEETGFDAGKLLDHLVEVLCGLEMPEVNDDGSPAGSGPESGMVPLINRKNLKHGLMPVFHSGVGGDRSKGFLHLTFAAGNDNSGRTAEVRRNAAEVLGDVIDEWVGDLPGLGSVTVHVEDIDRDRGYTTTASRKTRREAGSG